jgi:lipoprotein LprG
VTLPAPRRLRFLAAPVVLGLALAGLSACSDDDKDGGGDDGTAAAEALAAAKETLDATSGVTISLTTDDLPNGITGITAAEGTGVHPSAFEGTFKLSVSGLPADAEVIAVDG